MNLSEVWGYFNPDVRRVFTSLAEEDDRIRTKSLLGGLSDLTDNEASSILRTIESEANVELIHPESIVEKAGECPEGVTFSPCVKETLDFFRIHQLRPITVANLSLRLLQMGTGSTVMALEKSGHLEELRNRLESLTSG